MNPVEGIVLLCDLHGNLTEILRDPFGLGAARLTGRPFARLAARGSLGKAHALLAEINTLGSAFDWEINIVSGEQIKTLHFTGGKVNDNLLIVGAENGKLALQLYEEMIRIHSEQTNAPLAAYKENARDDAGYRSLYDEISRLNNELVSMQRELAKKNAELERLNEEKPLPEHGTVGDGE